MANIMIRRGAAGEYVFYLLKARPEDTITSMGSTRLTVGREIKAQQWRRLPSTCCPGLPISGALAWTRR
jgi:hypothetical protein